MRSCQIRAAQAKDAPGIANVHVGSWQAAYRTLLSDEVISSVASGRLTWWTEYLSRPHDHEHVLVATDGDQIVGFASARASPDDDADRSQAEVGALYVLPDRWGEGIGSALLAALLTRLRADAFETASLWVLARNEAAHRFYERRHWRNDGHERVHPQRATPEVRYRIKLSAA